MSTRKGTKGFLLGALAGGIVGSVTALLFAPKSGKELRGDISEGAQKVSDATLHAVSQVGETTGRVAKQIGGQAAELADKAKHVGIGVADTVKSWRGLNGSEDEAVVQVSGIESCREGLDTAYAEEDEERDEADIR